MSNCNNRDFRHLINYDTLSHLRNLSYQTPLENRRSPKCNIFKKNLDTPVDLQMTNIATESQ